MGYSEDKLLIILDQPLSDLLSGWHIARRVEVHHAITSAIYVLIASNYDYDLAAEAVKRKTDMMDFYYAIKNEREEHHLYFDWHEYSRCVTDLLREKNLDQQSNLAILRAFINAICNWVELQDDEAVMSASRLMAWKK